MPDFLCTLSTHSRIDIMDVICFTYGQVRTYSIINIEKLFYNLFPIVAIYNLFGQNKYF